MTQIFQFLVRIEMSHTAWLLPAKIGGRLVRHARSLVFQLVEVAVPREVFQQVLERIGGLQPAPG